MLFSHSVMSDSLWPHGLQHSRLPCPSPSPIAWSKHMSVELVMPSNHLVLYHPLLLPSIVPSSGSFPMCRLFTSDGQSIGASVSDSALSMNIQDWFSLGLTGLISLQSNGLSRVFSIPWFKSISSLVLSLLYGAYLTSHITTGKNHSFDYIDIFWQSDVSTF